MALRAFQRGGVMLTVIRHTGINDSGAARYTFPGSVTSRRGTGMLLDVSCCLSMNCQRPRVERSGSKAAILVGA